MCKIAIDHFKMVNCRLSNAFDSFKEAAGSILFGTDGRTFEHGSAHQVILTLSVNRAVNGYLFKSRKGKDRKGERWYLPFICCDLDTVGLVPLLLLRPLVYVQHLPYRYA